MRFREASTGEIKPRAGQEEARPEMNIYIYVCDFYSCHDVFSN